MKTIIHSVIFLTALLFLPRVIHGQNNTGGTASPLQTEASYTGDFVSNIRGGLTTGSRYLGMASLSLLFDTRQAGLWRGGELFINAANTHGSQPAAELTGDRQVISNIEAGNLTYLHEFWYKQRAGNFELTAGLQDLNADFALSDHGSLFLNSSFGILPVISGNISAPIFPQTNLGLTLKYTFNEKFTLLAALYDGDPVNAESNPHNLTWKISIRDKALGITEIQFITGHDHLPATIKAGLFFAGHLPGIRSKTDRPDTISGAVSGFYGYADKKLWQKNGSEGGFFIQAGFSPSVQSINRWYLGAGCAMTGIFDKKGRDYIGLAAACAYYSDIDASETAIELVYNYSITENIFLQPDIQYIVNPSGYDSHLPDALAGNLRFGISF